VFLVKKWPSRPNTGALKPRSAASSNSYWEAPLAGRQANAGSASTTAPDEGEIGTGVGSLAGAGAATTEAATRSVANVSIRVRQLGASGRERPVDEPPGGEGEGEAGDDVDDVVLARVDDREHDAHELRGLQSDDPPREAPPQRHE
jgi:hypothetical protein